MTVTEELFSISEAASAALADLQKAEIQQPLARLEQVCKEAKRAWSGSNLGYHADVYWDGLEAQSPIGQFNPEWGLMDRWPAHTPAREWRVMDPGDVRKTLLSRAGDPDIASIDASIEAAQERFSDLKEATVSLFMSILGNHDDPFVKRKLKETDELSVASKETIANSLVPRGQRMTRDTGAMT